MYTIDEGQLTIPQEWKDESVNVLTGFLNCVFSFTYDKVELIQEPCMLLHGKDLYVRV